MALGCRGRNERTDRPGPGVNTTNLWLESAAAAQPRGDAPRESARRRGIQRASRRRTESRGGGNSPIKLGLPLAKRSRWHLNQRFVSINEQTLQSIKLWR